MGQTVVVENVGGGGGSLGADQVAKAAPDGHTLLFHNITFTTTTSSLHVTPSARGTTSSDFVPVSVGAYVPLLLLAHPVGAGERPQGIRRLRQDAPRTPLFYGSTGPGSIMNLMGEVLKRDAGIKMDHVPFRGAAPLVHGDAVAGRIQFGGDQLSSSLEHVRSGAAQGDGGGDAVGRAAERADRARARLPESRAAGLERLPRAQGHAGAGDRARCSRRSRRR